MDTPFFPPTGDRVVPFVRVNDDSDLTVVKARKNGAFRSVLKLRIFRLALGSLFRVTFVNVEGENCRVTYTKRE